MKIKLTLLILLIAGASYYANMHRSSGPTKDAATTENLASLFAGTTSHTVSWKTGPEGDQYTNTIHYELTLNDKLEGVFIGDGYQTSIRYKVRAEKNTTSTTSSSSIVVIFEDVEESNRFDPGATKGTVLFGLDLIDGKYLYRETKAYDFDLEVGSGVVWTHTAPIRDKAVFLDQEFCDVLINKTIAENYDSGYNRPPYTKNGACELDIGKGKKLIFSFENISQGKEPEFILRIYTSTMSLIQSLPLAYDWEYNDATINLHDDINFDEYKDLIVRVFGPRAGEFTYYPYNPVTGLFEEDEILQFIFTPTFDPDAATITTVPNIPNYYRDENGEQQYYTAEDQTTVYDFVDGKYVAN